MSEERIAATEEPRVRRVIVNLCEPCIRGEDQECHTPGCALWLHKVDIPIGEELLEDADAMLAQLAAAERDRDAAREALEPAAIWIINGVERVRHAVDGDGLTHNELERIVYRLLQILPPTPPPEEDAR